MNARARAIQWLVQGQRLEQRSRFPITAFIGLLALLVPPVGAAQLSASVLPGSRSVQVGSRAKGKRPESYTREEVLEERYAELLNRLRFDDEVLA